MGSAYRRDDSTWQVRNRRLSVSSGIFISGPFTTPSAPRCLQLQATSSSARSLFGTFRFLLMIRIRPDNVHLTHLISWQEKVG